MLRRKTALSFPFLFSLLIALSGCDGETQTEPDTRTEHDSTVEDSEDAADDSASEDVATEDAPVEDRAADPPEDSEAAQDVQDEETASYDPYRTRRGILAALVLAIVLVNREDEIPEVTEFEIPAMNGELSRIDATRRPFDHVAEGGRRLAARTARRLPSRHSPYRPGRQRAR